MCRTKDTRRGPFPSSRVASRPRPRSCASSRTKAPKLSVFLQNGGFQVSLTQEGEVQAPGGDAPPTDARACGFERTPLKTREPKSFNFTLTSDAISTTASAPRKLLRAVIARLLRRKP